MNRQHFLRFQVGHGCNEWCSKCNGMISEKEMKLTTCDVMKKLKNNEDWFHVHCFFESLRQPINYDSIEDTDSLEFKEQLILRTMIKMHGKTDQPMKFLDLNNVKIRASRSDTLCITCSKKFREGEFKMMLADSYEHAQCLLKRFTHFLGKQGMLKNIGNTTEAKLFKEKFYNYVGVPADLESDDFYDGYADISTSRCVGNGRKRRAEDMSNELKKETRKAELKNQSEQLTSFKKFFHTIPAEFCSNLISGNGMKVFSNLNFTIDMLADGAVFGIPIQCENCENGSWIYDGQVNTYRCTGYIDVFDKCNRTERNPRRRPFVMLQNLLDNPEYAPLLKGLKFNKLTERKYPNVGQIMRAGKVKILEPMYPTEVLDNENWLEGKDLSTQCSTSISLLSGCDSKISRMGTLCLYSEYSARLTFVSVADNTNSFQKLQIVWNAQHTGLYVLHLWGRIGTTLGRREIFKYSNEDAAVDKFCSIFYAKTGNTWRARNNFEQKPGKFNMLIEEETERFKVLENPNVEPGERSQLPDAVKSVIKLICRTETLSSQKKAIEYDVNTLPLGRLSHDQIKKIMAVLTEMYTLLHVGTDQTILQSMTSLLYTHFPQFFGMEQPRIIDTIPKWREIKKKLGKIVDYAHKISWENEITRWKDPLDVAYESLRCKLTPLNKNSGAFRFIESYFKNTRGSSHTIEDELVDVFAIENGRAHRAFQKNIGGRKLLWHGSSTRNFYSILRIGLSIHSHVIEKLKNMFGNGIYFADMYSKSFFYSAGSQGEGPEDFLLLLCEVALGKSYETCRADKVLCSSFLPKGYQSVFAKGCEGPSETISHPEGFSIPIGKRSVQLERESTDLQYNEYIVYNPRQVKPKYLVRVRAHHWKIES